MKVAGRPMRTIWLAEDGRTVEIIDQTRLPHELVILRLASAADAAHAIRDMQVRGAPLIGAAAAYGVALAPVYRAYDARIPVHVWVDETRPRNQGASLTAWELGQHGVPHTVIADNAGGHLMRHGEVDLCITGTDRTSASGDVANKIGTYLKALAAADNAIPFYVALPSPTIDWDIEDGSAIPIEQRDPREVTHIAGWTEAGERVEVRLTPADSPAANYAFDVTPARLVTALITERGVCPASREGLLRLFPGRRRHAA